MVVHLPKKLQEYWLVCMGDSILKTFIFIKSGPSYESVFTN